MVRHASTDGTGYRSLVKVVVWPLWQEKLRRSETSMAGGDLRTGDMTSCVRGGDMVKGDHCLQPFVLRPDAKMRLVWDMLSVLALLIDIVLIPCMLLPLREMPAIETLGLLITAFWSVDIGFSFMSGYYESLGFVEMRPAMIAKRYVRGWFILDLSSRSTSCPWSRPPSPRTLSALRAWARLRACRGSCAC